MCAIHASWCRGLHRQVFPHDEGLDSAHLQAHERVGHARHVLARVLADLIEELADQALLLHELDIRQRVAGQLDGLVEAILTACTGTAPLQSAA